MNSLSDPCCSPSKKGGGVLRASQPGPLLQEVQQYAALDDRARRQAINKLLLSHSKVTYLLLKESTRCCEFL